MNSGSNKARGEIRDTRGVFPATDQAMEAFIAELGLRDGWCADPADSFAAELLLRELLTNAVRHGSCGEPERLVRCAIRSRGSLLTINVQDEGAGFDWRRAIGRESKLSDPCGRGLQILRTYSTAVRFSDKGNAVTVRRRFGMESYE
jgi:hypothetical protein